MLFANGHRTVGRVAAIMEMVGAEPHLHTLSTLAARLDAPRASVHALLRGLLATGYVVEHAGRYALGNALRTVLRDDGNLDLLIAMARPEIEQLSAAWDETAVIGVRVGNSLVYIDQVESTQPVRFSATLWSRRSLLDTSMGKLYLSEMDELELQRLAESLSFHSEIDALSAELVDIRREGVAHNQKRTVTDVSGVSVGVRARDGRFAATVGLIGPAYRMAEKNTIADVTACATAVSRLVAARSMSSAGFGRRTTLRR